MGDLNIGRHDRGMLDREDQLRIKRSPLQKGLNADAAMAAARNRNGAEAIVRQQDGTYSVYALETSEAGKTITHEDFNNQSARVSQDTFSALGAGKAYVMTQDNALRTLEIEGIDLHHLEQSLATADLSLNLSDIDGIDSKSKADLKGTLGGSIVFDRALLEYSLAQANKEMGGVRFELESNPRDQQYRINVSYGVGLGHIILKPQGAGLKVEVGGLAGGLANAADWLGKKVGYDPQQMVRKLIDQHISQDMGLKIQSQSITDYTLAPDLSNNPLLKEIPVNPSTKFKVESIQIDPARTGFRMDNGGNLVLNLDGASVTGSSLPGGAVARPDAEGPDSLGIGLKASLRNDLQGHVEADVNLKVNVTAAEQQSFGQRIQEWTGQSIQASGQIEVKDISVKADIGLDGKLQNLEHSAGSLDFKKLRVEAQGASVQLDSASGILSGEQQADGSLKLTSRDVSLKGKITAPEGSLTINQLKLEGDLAINPNNPNALSFTTAPGKRVQFSGSANAQGQNINIQGLSVQNSRLDIDMGKGQLSVKPTVSQGQTATLSRLSMPQADIRNLTFRGSMSGDLYQGNFQLDARSFGLKGTFGDLQLDQLSGSGKLAFSAANGLSLTNGTIDAKGRVGDLEIKKLKGSGDIHVNAAGQLVTTNTRNLELETNMGLSLKGNLQASYAQGTYYVATNSDKPVSVTYSQPQLGLDLKDLQFKGKMEINERTGAMRITSGDQPAQLSKGSISGTPFENVTLDKGEMLLNPSTGALTFQPPAGEQMVFNGTVQGLKIENLRASGPIAFDPNKQTISWDTNVSADLPAQNIRNFSSEGPVSVKIRPDGNVVVRADGGRFSGNFGTLAVKDMQVQGEVIYNPRSGEVRFHGQDNQPFVLNGSLNGRDLNLESPGELIIQDKPEHIEISGQGLRLKGLLDGFNLESPGESSGKLLLSKDMSTVDLRDLNFNISIDNIGVSNREGLLKTTPTGYELNLSGNLEAKKEQLFALLNKFSSNDGLANEAMRGTIQQVMNTLNTHFSQFSGAEMDYKALTVKLDKQFQFQGFSVDQSTQIQDARIDLDLGGRKPKNVSLGNVTWEARAEATPTDFRINDGGFSFDLNEELRTALANTAKEQLEASGFKDVDIAVTPSGQIEIRNASYAVKAKGKQGNNGTEVNIPILSRLLKKPKTVANISAKLDIETRMEGNKLHFEIDNLKMRGLLAQIINKAIDGEDKVADVVAQQLRAEDIAFSRKDGESLFTLDLNPMVQKYVDKGLTLEDVKVSETGRVEVVYDYQQKLQ
jgi:hypothetical protein